MPAGLPRRRGIATFLLLVVLAEVVGRSLTLRVDRALHVAPLAPSGADYYPLLLVTVKVLAALGLAALLTRFVRAQATAEAGRRLLGRLGHAAEPRAPRLQVGLSPRAWLLSFVLTSAGYLVQADAERTTHGPWPLLAPLLHTYSLPVFAALSVLVALAWSLAGWLRAVEEHAAETLAHARRMLRAVLAAPERRRFHASVDLAPRRRFGLVFECRPPPLAVT